MQLFLFESNFSAVSQRRLYERARENDEGEVKHVFLVPDRYTVGVETDLCKYCFNGAFSNADVASFTRYAVKTVGKRINKCLSKEGTVILLGKVMAENSEKLRYYKNPTGYNFARELFAAIASLRSAEITPDKIEEAAQDKSGPFYDKLRDIALIYREYERTLKERFTDTVTRIDELISYVDKNDFSDTYFYILGFNIFSEQQMSLIKALIKSSAGVAISMMKNENFSSLQGDILADYCAEIGAECVRRSEFTERDYPYRGFRERLFRAKEGSVKGENVVLFKEDSPAEEVLAAAREITYLIRREGYRYRDISAVVNNDKYLPIVREIFDRCDVPLFIDEGYDVTDGIIYRYIDALIAAAEEGMPEDFVKLALHPFCDLDRDEVEKFRLYCKKYYVKNRKFFKKFAYGDCEEAEKVRAFLAEKVESVPKSGKVSDYCEFFSSVIDEEGAQEVLERYRGNSDARLVAAADEEPIKKLLAETAMLMGETEAPLERFSEIFRSATADMKTVLRPDYYDAVFVGNTEESRFSEAKILFVLGANDEYFPLKSGDGLIFTALDNEHMRGLGMNVFPSPVEKNALERAVTLDILSKPTDKIYLGCSESDLAGEKIMPGDYYSETAFLAGQKPKTLAEYRNFTDEERLNYLLVTPQNAYYEYVSGKVPPEYSDCVKKYLVSKGLLTGNAEREETPYSLDGVFRRADNGAYLISVSDLEPYFNCPFKFFMQKGLRAAEEEDSVISGKDIGIAIHEILSVFFKENIPAVYGEGDFEREMDSTIERVLSEEQFLRYRENPISSHILLSLKKECKKTILVIIENLRHSAFRPHSASDLELRFGKPNDKFKLSITVNNMEFILQGCIDRIDRSDDGYIGVVDYKTGGVEPDLTDVYCGKKIQLYLYLTYLVKSGQGKPAGVFYMPIKSGSVKDGRSYAMRGQMLNSAEVFGKFDDRAEGEYVSPHINFKIKDGVISTNKAHLLTEGQFYEVMDYVEELMKTAIGEISEGYAEKKPLNRDANCAFCAYKAMCGRVPERKVSGKKIEDFERALNGGNDE